MSTRRTFTTQTQAATKRHLKDAQLTQTFWGQAITKCLTRGFFLQSEVKLSGSWQACACGRQSCDLPRKYMGEPIDAKLAAYGVAFYRYISQHMPLQAAKTLIEIEDAAVRVLYTTKAKYKQRGDLKWKEERKLRRVAA